MITLVKGNRFIEVDDAPVFNNVPQLRVYNNELFVKRSIFGEIYNLVNLDSDRGVVRDYYKVSIDNKMYIIKANDVMNFWYDYTHNTNDITLVVNGAEITKLSSNRLSEVLSIPVEEVKNLLNTQYADTFVVD